jgi:hypothetical protein
MQFTGRAVDFVDNCGQKKTESRHGSQIAPTLWVLVLAACYRNNFVDSYRPAGILNLNHHHLLLNLDHPLLGSFPNHKSTRHQKIYS